MKRHLLVLTACLVSATPAWSCLPPRIEEPPPLERLAGESDVAFAGRQDAFRRAHWTREGHQGNASNARWFYQEVVTEGQRQEALWDRATDIVLARVVSIIPAPSEGRGDRVRYQTDRVLKGRSRISTINRVGTPDIPPPSCTYYIGPDAPVGEAVVIFLQTSRSTTVRPTRVLPLRSVDSERLWAIINGTAPTP